MKKLQSYKFEYENYEPNYWSALDMAYNDLNTESLAERLKQHGIGYCDGSLLKVRPRTSSIAVMCVNKNYCEEPFWFHVADWQFIEIFPDIKEVNH